jgi:hypothetical protein
MDIEIADLVICAGIRSTFMSFLHWPCFRSARLVSATIYMLELPTMLFLIHPFKLLWSTSICLPDPPNLYCQPQSSPCEPTPSSSLYSAQSPWFLPSGCLPHQKLTLRLKAGIGLESQHLSLPLDFVKLLEPVS